MKNRIYFIILLFITSFMFGQNVPANFTFVGNVLADTKDFDNYFFKDVLPPILDSKNTIEIRFLIAPDMKVDTLITLYYNGKWNAKKYNLETNEELTLKINDEKQKLVEIFQKLVNNDIFNLPKSSSINIAPTYINLETGEIMGMMMGVTHATTYIVQFKVGNQYRLYSFSSPEHYAKTHPVIQEFKNYTNIMKIFQTIE